MKKIGLFGLTFSDPNKGCMTLAYAFFNILKEIANQEQLDIVIFSDHSYSIEHLQHLNDKLELFSYNIKSIKSLFKLSSKIQECDIFFDFTEGDSFSDIYGLKRFIKFSFIKLLVIMNKKDLVLGPQTIGPFNSFIAKKIGSKIIKKSKYVCTRDELSTNYIYDLTGLKVDTFTDVGFMLPANDEIIVKSKKIKVGINISALLYNGGYNSKNQFKLEMDYKNYCEKLIEELNKKNKYEIYLIPHVYSDDMPSIENDYVVCEKLVQKYPYCHLPEMYFSPCDIKGFIANMDVFIGARMHSTIAAFSSLVPVIPVSYSRKFEGLYNSLNYDYLVDAKEWNTNEALAKTFEYLENLTEMQEKEKSGMKVIAEKSKFLTINIKKLIERN